MATDDRPAERYKKTIELKPSSELLPDEYVVKSTKNVCVEIFYGKEFVRDANLLQTTFELYEYTVHIHSFNSQEEISHDIKERRLTRRMEGIFVFVLCKGEENSAGCLFGDDSKTKIKFEDMWEPFLKLNCLNRKPKMFLYQTHFSGVQTEQFDGAGPPRRMYNIAAPGADLLLVSRAIDKKFLRDDGFINNICEYIKSEGKTVDIIEIVTFATTQSRPLIVSTLTARFFMQASDCRYYHERFSNGLKEIDNYISQNNP